ncbi:MAG: peptidoglycan -binding protein, partial [Paracoccaceae bacterium]|nr:peptidoglycan -binding protein [Paracoccaceae bacterium]
AEALRERLKNAQSELTAMTLALEAQRKEAEDTLTLLAAAKTAEDELNAKLAAALLAGAEIDLKLRETQTSLENAQEARANAGSKLSSVEAALVQALLDLDSGSSATAATQIKLDEALFELSRAQDSIRILERQLAALRIQVDQGEAAIADVTGLYEDEKTARASAELAVLQAGSDRNDLTELLAQTRVAVELANETAARALAGQAAAEERVAALRSEAAALQDELTQARASSVTASRSAAELELSLAQALAARDAAATDRGDLEVQLASALAAKLAAQAGLEQLQLSVNQDDASARLEDELAKALEAKMAAEAKAADDDSALAQAEKTMADLREELAKALLKRQLADENAAEKLTEAERNAALLKIAQDELSKAELQSADQQRDLALLNVQVADLRTQMGKLQSLIDEAEAKDIASNVQITALGNRLNTALTRAAAEERRRRQLEEQNNALLAAEKDRLAAENEALEKYRSDFFGQLRELVGDREGVQIVGDRFVFSSEVLFSSGEAELSEEGQAEIANIADLLNDISKQIPPEIDWIIRVDGHTDNVRMLPGGDFADNWELSQARALSVVRDLVQAHGMKPNRVSANGFGQYQPLNPTNNAEARAQNRRIELKLTER